MLINMVLPGAAGSAEEPFAFEYSGNFTDNRVDGVGTVRLNTSGTLTVLSGKVTVSVYILGAGGGGAWAYLTSQYRKASGGGGGNQTVEVTLEAGTYEITIGTGGEGKRENATITGGTGGSTTAFGYTSTGGKGGKASTSPAGGAGGTPNGNKGSAVSTTASGNLAGGSPNGGAATSVAASSNGGDGYVDLTFS